LSRRRPTVGHSLKEPVENTHAPLAPRLLNPVAMKRTSNTRKPLPPRPTPIQRLGGIAVIPLADNALVSDATWEGGGPRTVLVPPLRPAEGTWQ
jgi:hypothetical protein